MRRSWTVQLLLLGFGIAAVVPAAWAQVPNEGLAGLQFYFGVPGARSLGMGGAFLGLADDATSAYTNPAGLTQLERPEVSMEGRRSQYTHLFPNSGRANEVLSGTQSAPHIDSLDLSGLVYGKATNTVDGVSFLSVVWPKEFATFAFYRLELTNFKADFQTDGSLIGINGSQNPAARLFPSSNHYDLEIVDYGLSAGFKIGKSLSLGIGLSFYDYKGSGRTERFFFKGFTDVSFDPANVRSTETFSSSKGAFAPNLGLLWRLGSKVALGATIRPGPSFEGDYQLVLAGAAKPTEVLTTRLKVPDVYGIGFSYRPVAELTLVADWNRIQYSDLSKGLVVPQASGNNSGEFKLRDGNEYRLGLEYVFAKMAHPLSIRLGAWRDPAHQLTFEQGPPSGGDPFAAVLLAAGQTAKDETHYTGGFGLVLGQHMRIDAAADHSDRLKIYSLSAVVYF